MRLAKDVHEANEIMSQVYNAVIDKLDQLDLIDKYLWASDYWIFSTPEKGVRAIRIRVFIQDYTFFISGEPVVDIPRALVFEAVKQAEPEFKPFLQEFRYKIYTIGDSYSIKLYYQSDLRFDPDRNGKRSQKEYERYKESRRRAITAGWFRASEWERSDAKYQNWVNRGIVHE